MQQPIQISDGDYILADGAAWLETGGFAIRISTTPDGIMAEIYESGKEYNSAISGAYAFNSELTGE